jgi:hypothetical protein
MPLKTRPVPATAVVELADQYASQVLDMIDHDLSPAEMHTAVSGAMILFLTDCTTIDRHGCPADPCRG